MCLRAARRDEKGGERARKKEVDENRDWGRKKWSPCTEGFVSQNYGNLENILLV